MNNIRNNANCGVLEILKMADIGLLLKNYLRVSKFFGEEGGKGVGKRPQKHTATPDYCLAQLIIIIIITLAL